MKPAPSTTASDFTTAKPHVEETHNERVPQTSETHAGEQRGASGRFAAGNRGGPGNPFARQTARLRQAMLDAVSPEDMQAVIGALKKKAADGDVAAAKLLLSYCIGKPTAPENPDTLDLHELTTIMANHLDSSEGPLNIIKGMPLSVIVEMFRIILPILRANKVELAKRVLTAPLTEEEIEDGQDYQDHQEENDSPSPTDESARDPLENIPQWMRDMGNEPEQPETEQPAPRPAAKRKKKGPAHQEAPAAQGPSQPQVDAELLRVLLERARQLKAANPTGKADDPANAQAVQEIAELLQSRNGQHPPSSNGSNGKR
jgi:hypothetical protein